MFERVATQSTFTSGVAFNQPNCSNDNLVVKQIIEVHKNLLMLRDNKASRTNIMAILEHYNIPAQKSNKKIGDLNELLLKHCHSFLSVPITFVPDCSIENYSEAPEQKKSTLPDKQLNEFVPVAFVNDSMVNLVKTQENEAETPGTKQLDLKPMKHGYMHERHVPRRNRKVSKSHNATKKLKTTVRRESKEDRTMHEQSTEVQLCTEMPSSDSEEDFESDFNVRQLRKIFSRSSAVCLKMKSKCLLQNNTIMSNWFGLTKHGNRN